MESKTAEKKLPNRRASTRRRARNYVKLECRRGALGLGKNVGSVLMDVSETGARIVSSQELKIDQEVEVVFVAHGLRNTVKRLANVRWQLKLEDGNYCLGVEFQKRLDYADWLNISLPS